MDERDRKNQQGFTLGKWMVRPAEGRLCQGTTERRISPMAMKVLLALCERPGRVYSREELLAGVWGVRAVSDEPLTRCISELRRSFDDSRATPEYIETLSKRGYRLLARPQPPDPLAAPSQEETAAPETSREDSDAVLRQSSSIAVLPFENLSTDPEQDF